MGRILILMSLLVVCVGVRANIRTSFGPASQQFCNEIPIWPRNTEVPVDEQYLKYEVAIPVDAKFVSERVKDENWVLIDVRRKKGRKKAIPGSLKIQADAFLRSQDEFRTGSPINLVLSTLQSYRKGPLTEDQLAHKNIVLYCDNLKCTRSTYAACKLRESGIAFANIFVMLGGVNEWVAMGLPTE